MEVTTTIGTTALYEKLLDEHGSSFRSLSFDLLDGFVSRYDLEDHPYANTLLVGLGLDVQKSIKEQLAATYGSSTPGLCDAVGYLVCGNSFVEARYKVTRYGVEPLMQPSTSI